MRLTKVFHILTCVAISTDDDNNYISQLEPVLFDTIEDAKNFIMSDEQIIFQDIEDKYIIWHTFNNGKLFYYTLWF